MKILLAGVIILLVAGTAFSQDYVVQIRPTAEDPFPHAVNQIIQDRQGMIWLATSSGLFRYDGINIEPIGPDTYTIPALVVVHETTDGTIWVGGEHGRIGHVSNGDIRWIPLPDTSRPTISALAWMGDSLVVATHGNGLYLNVEGSWSHFGHPGLLADNFINSLVVDTLGNLWVTHDRGIQVFDRNMKTLMHYGKAEGLPDQIVLSMRAGPDGTMWFGTHDGGFGMIRPGSMRAETPYLQPWVHGAISDILPLADGSTWLATTSHSLLEWRSNKLHQVSDLRGRTFINPTCLFEDLEGNVWIGARKPGLVFIDRRLSILHASLYPQTEGITAIHAGSNGMLWFATLEGLFSFNTKHHRPYEITHHSRASIRGSDLIISIHEMGEGTLWLGTFGQGLIGYRPSSGHHIRITEQHGLVNDNVLSLSSNNGNLWLATLGGAAHMTSRSGELAHANFSFRNYVHQDGLGTNYIYGVYIDSRNREWFSTDGHGITVLDGEQFTTYGVMHGLTSEVVYAVAEDPDGHFWASTLDGLFMFDGTRFERVDTTIGLRNNQPAAIACDLEGRLVVAHQRGIDVVDTRTRHVMYLTTGPDIALGEAGLNMVSRDSMGDIWIGTQEGIVRYRPSAQNVWTRPATRLRQIRVFLLPVPADRNAVYRYADNHLTFDYIGLWYQDPTRVVYQHKLEGYDIDWVASRDQTAIYPALKPGPYTFRVRSSADGHFDAQGEVAYAFRVRPPLWQTPLFVGAMVLLIGALVYGYILAREKRIHKVQALEQARVEFQFQTLRSQVNPHFLFNSFNTLMMMIEEDKQQAVIYVQTLSDFFRNILRFRDVEVIGLDEELKVLQGYYFLQRQRFGKKFSMDIRIEEPDRFMIPPLTLQLLVENALKHNVVSTSRPLVIEVFIKDSYLVVRNNLQHKKEPEKSTHMGLSNIRKRYQILCHQEVLVEESEGRFQVRLPLITKAS